ncbi:hypothetical protein IX293_002285 [Fusobacterium necrophorum]|nr:Txe/YoeB family addiction module toxin [Fusobacterium necrophorum]MBR8824010.1 hypothetical protein [Fusobacterium necrophorum]MCF0161527.1 Txe/YoeB family addiction module toxin [Fusobacterium necrophorum]
MVEEYKIILTKQAIKDKEKIKHPALNNVKNLLKLIQKNPFTVPPFYEALVGEFKGLYSRRINKQHRLIYRVLEEEKIIMIVSLWTHYNF